MRTQIAAAAVCLLALATPSAFGQSLTRGPFLQQVHDTSAQIVFRTDAPVTARVRFGTSPGALSGTVQETVAGTQHVIPLTGLTANTTYFYAVDLGTATVSSGPNVWFHTGPSAGTTGAFRFFVLGNTGIDSAHRQAVANQMMAEVARPAFILYLGNLASPTSTDANLDAQFFQAYAPLLQNSAAWPTVGQNEALAADGGTYAASFSLPANNQANSPFYGSFDYGNGHFTMLATEVVPFNSGSAQQAFAQGDLAGAAGAGWRFAFFDQPLFSGGTPPADPQVQSALETLLESNFVDLVFSGRSAAYERTGLVQSAVNVESSADGGYTNTGGSARTMYMVSGVGGAQAPLTDAGVQQMDLQLGNISGVAIIDVQGPVLHGYFLDEAGGVHDQFTLAKGADTLGPEVLGLVPGPAATRVALQFNEPVQAGAGANGAENPANYTIIPSVTVSQATLGPDLRTVTLTTAAHAAGNYTLAVRNVQDRAPTPNTMAPVSLGYAFVAAAGGDGGTDGGGGNGTHGPCTGCQPGEITPTPSGCNGCSSSGMGLGLSALGLVLLRRKRR